MKDIDLIVNTHPEPRHKAWPCACGVFRQLSIKVPALLLFLLNATCMVSVSAQYTEYSIIAPQCIESKAYYFVSVLRHVKALDSIVSTNTKLNELGCSKLKALGQAETTAGRIAAMKFNDAEIKAVADELVRIYDASPIMRDEIEHHVTRSGCYGNIKSKGAAFVRAAWTQDARGMNYAIDVYAAGIKPNYPAIDSIGFNVHSKKYNDVLLPSCQQNIVFEAQTDSRFYSVPLIAVRTMLDINDRMQAVIEEPLDAGHNRKAYALVADIDWKRYPYTAILVLGSGPDEPGIAISPEGKLRSGYAAELYRQGFAPFIIVSGGSVHPYHTSYNEAVEMKRYLMTEHGIPESAVIIEPHARHTTTNFRNAARIMLRHGFPIDRPALVTSSAYHIEYVGKMADRCLKELGLVPYRLGDAINERVRIFYPTVDALTINPNEPLDP